ncbi:TIR domain-containing protein [Halomonas sp. BM-2019]|uniref:TIR domain-containing protein n=1 Tax=Halomonas sp. BM-2019 TaxID=2811227 RepID=UPI001B3C4119|nr:MAG: TIR domain-containing protein [Halomonas sp. BM-2019]
MSYVGLPFTHDLFVSYSHGADDGGNAFLKEWSVAFVKELEQELRTDRKYRDGLSVFLDEDHRQQRGVDPMAPLTDQLQREIGASALLMVLMSPDYLASDWCAKERDWWCTRQAQRNLPAEGHLAVVRIWPTEPPWPPALTDASGHPLVGFPFYSSDDMPVRPFGWVEVPGPFGSDFRKALLGIVGRLYPKLDDLKTLLDERLRAEDEAARLVQTGGQSIYLHGRADHAREWERAGIALTDDGFVVLPGEPDPVEHDPHRLQEARERRVETMSACDALLLLGTEDGLALDLDLVVVGKHDRQSARARSNRLLPCGLLDTVGEPIATPVRRANARNVQADWLDGTRDPWTPEVRRWLGEKSALLEPALLEPALLEPEP